MEAVAPAEPVVEDRRPLRGGASLARSAKVSPAQRAELPAREPTGKLPGAEVRRFLRIARYVQHEDARTGPSAMGGMLEALDAGIIASDLDPHLWQRAVGAEAAAQRKALYIKLWMEVRAAAPVGMQLLELLDTPIAMQPYERTVPESDLIKAPDEALWRAGPCRDGLPSGGLCNKPRAAGKWHCTGHRFCAGKMSFKGNLFPCDQERINGTLYCPRHTPPGDAGGIWTRLGESRLRDATVIDRGRYDVGGVHPRRRVLNPVPEGESVTRAWADAERDARERAETERLKHAVGEPLPGWVVVAGEKPYLPKYDELAALLNGKTVTLPWPRTTDPAIEVHTSSESDSAEVESPFTVDQVRALHGIAPLPERTATFIPADENGKERPECKMTDVRVDEISDGKFSIGSYQRLHAGDAAALAEVPVTKAKWIKYEVGKATAAAMESEFMRLLLQLHGGLVATGGDR